MSNNIEAFTDTIRLYKDKNDELIASKTLIEGQFSDLKKINEDLYDKVKNMNIGKPQQVVKIETVYSNEPTDTVLVLKDSVANFEFSNSYRLLSGTIHTKSDSIGLSIEKDEVYFDYTVALKDNKVYISSSNPYVKYNSITGLTVTNSSEKNKRWSLGPSLSAGYGVINKKPDIYVGLSVSYGLFKW